MVGKARILLWRKYRNQWETKFYQNIGPRYRRADVAGVRNADNPFEDQIEIVALEVRDRTRISDQDIRDTVNYRRYAHKCYLATTAPITDKYRRIAEQTNIGLLQLEKGKNEPIVLHSPTPKDPENYTEMMAFLNSFQIIKCSICGCFFERFVRPDEAYYSYLDMTRAKYFRVMKENKEKNEEKDPLCLKEVGKLPSEYKITRYICYPCLEELFLIPKRIERIRRKKEREKELHAYFSKKDDGFICNLLKDHQDLVYNSVEIVEHLRDEHGIDPEDQTIGGWTPKHERTWKRYSQRNIKIKDLRDMISKR